MAPLRESEPTPSAVAGDIHEWVQALSGPASWVPRPGSWVLCSCSLAAQAISPQPPRRDGS